MGSAIAACTTFNIASSCHSAFAVGRVRVTFPVLDLQVQLHQPPAQEKKKRQRPREACLYFGRL